VDLCQPAPDLVLLNGKIWTVNPAQPVAQAVACRTGRIAAVGSDAEIQSLVRSSTRVINLHGRFALPGFNDAHVHFLSGGQSLTGVQLRTAKSEQEFRDRLSRYVERLPRGRWVTGGNWDHENWSPPRLPSRRLIDDVIPDNPVFVKRVDAHMALANSAALRIAGIGRDTPDPPGGVIVRDSDGEPTGILKDAGMTAVYRVVPPPTDEEGTEAIRAAMRCAAEHGVTSVQDMSAAPVLRLYENLLAARQLGVRICGYQPLPDWERGAAVRFRDVVAVEKLKAGGFKGFADGSLGSATALFFEPYQDLARASGLPSEEMIPERAMLDRILDADAAGHQVAIHAIGDKANHLILNMYQEAEHRNGRRDRRFRIEHAQHLLADDMGRFGALRVVASVQPLHLADDGRWAENRIGPLRAKHAYAFRSLQDSGAILAFGSDWDVAPIDPLLGIHAAVTRRTLDGKHPGGWVPEQKITPEEAIRAYTMGSAYAAFDEKVKGSLEPGKLADIVVLSRDILTIAPEEIEDTKVEMTIFDGRVVYESG
jgi:predicted amidohydrolase YtcJ